MQAHFLLCLHLHLLGGGVARHVQPQPQPQPGPASGFIPLRLCRPSDLTNCPVQPAGTTTSPGETATRSSSWGPNMSLSWETADTGEEILAHTRHQQLVFPAMKTVWRRESSLKPAPERTSHQVSRHLRNTDSSKYSFLSKEAGS